METDPICAPNTCVAVSNSTDESLLHECSSSSSSGYCSEESISVKRYPKRTVPIVDYKEEAVPGKDEYIYCDVCETDYVGACPNCGPLIALPDSYVPKGTKNRAMLTVPVGILEVKPSGIHGLGVWASKRIPEKVKMGPYEGVRVKTLNDRGYCWETKNGKGIDAYDKRRSNWLRYVNCARNHQEQNLIAFEYSGNIYYRTFAPIEAGTELLVFYGTKFARKLNLKDYFEAATIGQPLPVRNTRNKQHEIDRRSDLYECEYCHIGTILRGFLKNHSARCTSRPAFSTTTTKKNAARPKKFACRHCSYVTTASQLKRHINAKHTRKQTYKCGKCNFTTYWPSSLHRHKYKHYDTGPFVCVTCEKCFYTPKQLKHHMKQKTCT